MFYHINFCKFWSAGFTTAMAKGSIQALLTRLHVFQDDGSSFSRRIFYDTSKGEAVVFDFDHCPTSIVIGGGTTDVDNVLFCSWKYRLKCFNSFG